ncbi:MAG: hypothetical protein ACREVH_11695 [Gammaproteobacteria bacterium]
MPVLLVALVAGAGGWGFQDTDWLKHNSILRDLITKPWPVIYEIQNERLMLTYYIAYQLPAAFAGKLLGWQAANHVLFLYTTIGLCLAALWMWLLTEAKWWWFIITFLAFSGMDIIGQLISTLYQAPSTADGVRVLIDRIGALQHLEWWSGWGFAQFSSNAALIVWVPNQAIAGWLLTSLVLNDAKVGCLHMTGLLYLGLCTLWTPFVTLGLIPFVVAIAFSHLREQHFSYHGLRQLVSWPNVTGLFVGIIVATYLAGRFEDYALPVDLGKIYQERVTLTFLRIPELFVVRYALFVALEFAALHGLLYLYLMLQREPLFIKLRGLLLLSSGILFALPFLNWGWNNEPAMRTSIPALFVTALVTIRVLSDPPRGLQARWVSKAILGVLAVGSINAAVEIGRHVTGTYHRHALVSVPELHDVKTLFQIQEERYRGYYSFVGQYLGSADSRFAQHLAIE